MALLSSDTIGATSHDGRATAVHSVVVDTTIAAMTASTLFAAFVAASFLTQFWS